MCLRESATTINAIIIIISNDVLNYNNYYYTCTYKFIANILNLLVVNYCLPSVYSLLNSSIACCCKSMLCNVSEFWMIFIFIIINLN